MLKARMRLSAFGASLKYNQKKIDAAIDRLDILPSRNAEFVNRQAVKVGAVRLEYRRHTRLEDYIAQMNGYMQRAAAEGAQLVAFPELSGLMALWLLPGAQRLESDILALDPDANNLQEAFLLAMDSFGGFLDELFVGVFSGLARAWNLPVAAGSYYTPDGGRVVNRQMLFDGEGALIGLQDKLYLSDLERKMGVSPGEQVAVFDSPVGRIALLTAQDALSFEPFWLAKALGADLVIAGADPFGRAPDATLYRANENRLCIVGPGIVVDSPLLRHSMPAFIKAPFAATRGQDGLVIEGGEVAVGRADLDRIAADFDVYSADQNPQFVRRYCTTPR
jgi:predicted amidohydrolase